jgi:hypothetical protein
MSNHFTDTHPRARKPHRCSLCWRWIRAGETYRRGAGMDGSTAWTWKECAHCEALIPLVTAEVNPWGEEYDASVVSDWDPATVAHLRLKVLFLRQWTDRDGHLYPIPEHVYRDDEKGWPRLVDVVLP